MNKFISSLLYRFNKIEPAALIVVVISLFYISFHPYFNEEIYFGFSKAYMDPQWIPGSTLFTDFAGTRLLFQVIFGWIMKFISFEQMAFFGRLLGYILMAFPLAAIVKELKMNNIVLVFWLTIFFIPQQNFYAGEWIFGGFETKTIAYVFVLWSIFFTFRKEYLKAIIFASVSIYWHMLVGGWYTLYLFIYLLIVLKLQRKFILYWIVGGIIVLPFVAYIYFGLVSGNENIIHGVNIGYLYAYVRNPHHVGILRDWDYFYHYHAGKVAMAVIAYLIAIFVYRKKIPAKYKWMNTFLIIILSQNLLFLIVALFDKNGFVAKFYPWRGSTLAMLFFQLTTIIMLRYVWLPKFISCLRGKFTSLRSAKIYIVQMAAFLLISIVVLGFTVEGRIEKARINEPGWTAVDKAALALKEASKPGDMFMLLGEESLYNVALSRKAERDIYYLYRCIPSQSPVIYDWYCRGQEQEKVNADINYLEESGLDKKIDFIVSTKDLNAPFLGKFYDSDGYRIYRVLHENSTE
ncbi:MAG: hypothetical protein H6540_03645 [Bacteroidales bacterium]|nr:hypothetical protein [Bacteroidales bacterium]